MRSDPRTYPLDLDIGDVADGYHLIVRSISLAGANLVVDWAFVPEPAEEAYLWPNMSYDADVSPRGSLIAPRSLAPGHCGSLRTL